jgi:hypothetical protein
LREKLNRIEPQIFEDKKINPRRSPLFFLRQKLTTLAFAAGDETSRAATSK